jgi:hypothetical protein
MSDSNLGKIERLKNYSLKDHFKEKPIELIVIYILKLIFI